MGENLTRESWSSARQHVEGEAARHDVIVIGSGPTGLATALMPARHGVQVTVDNYACILHVKYAGCMTTIQVRNVPEETSRALKAKAAQEGRSLSDYLLGELQRIASQPSRAQLLARIAARGVRELPPAEDVLVQQRPDR